MSELPSRILKPGEIVPPRWKRVAGTNRIRFVADKTPEQIEADRLAMIAAAVATWMESNRASLQGKPGTPAIVYPPPKDGEDGDDASPEQIAAAVSAWLTAHKAELKGEPGKAATQWPKPRDGEDGDDGAGIADITALVDRKEWVITIKLTDGSERELRVALPKGRIDYGGGSSAPELYDQNTVPASPSFPYLRFERDGAGDVQRILLGTAT